MNVNPLSHDYKFTAEQQKEKLLNACADFESYFYKLIMKTARNNGFESNLLKKSNAEKIFTDMFDDEVSKLASNKSSGGIKDMLFNSLKGSVRDVKGNNFQAKLDKAYDLEKNTKFLDFKPGIDIAQ
jgi:flagellar protein FlgJ